MMTLMKMIHSYSKQSRIEVLKDSSIGCVYKVGIIQNNQENYCEKLPSELECSLFIGIQRQTPIASSFPIPERQRNN